MSSRLRNLFLISGIVLAMLLVAFGADYLAKLSSNKRSVRVYQHLTVGEPDPASYIAGELNTKLPIVSIQTGGEKIPGNTILDEEGASIGHEMADDGANAIVVQVEIFDEEGAYNHTSGDPSLASAARIRIRGNSSRLFDKKSYKLSFVDEQGLESKLDIMGMGRHDEWALYGPFLDKTLIRNYLFLNIYGELDPATPDVRFCEVMVDGQYQGLYMMMELISTGESRIDLTPSSTRGDKTSYIVRLDRQWGEAREFPSFALYTMNLEPKSCMAVVYPGSSSLTQAFKDYIAQDFSRFEKALYSYDFNDEKKGYRAYVDVQSFVDYYIVCEFLTINDMCSRSTYLYKDLGDKIHMGPGWDFNNASDNFITDVAGTDGTGFIYTERTWFKMLMKDEYFVEQVIRTYREMREDGILDEERLLALVDDTAAFLGDSVERNFDVWGYSFDPDELDNYNKLRPAQRNPRSYGEALEQLKMYIVKRGTWMDANIEALRQYCDHAKIKQYLD